MDAARRYLSEVDRVLAAACDIFPEPASPTVTVLPTASAPIPAGQGALADETETRAASYAAWEQRVASAVESADRAAIDAAATVGDTGVTAQRIRDDARGGGRALGIDAPDLESLQALVSRLDGALAAMQAHITDTQSYLSEQEIQMRSALEIFETPGSD